MNNKTSTNLSAVPVLAEPETVKVRPKSSIGDKSGEVRESTKLEQPTARSNHSPQVSDSRGGAQNFPTIEEQLQYWREEQLRYWRNRRHIPNFIRSSRERQRLHNHGYGDAEDIGGNWTPDRVEANLDRYSDSLPRQDTDLSERLLSRDRDDHPAYQEDL